MKKIKEYASLKTLIIAIALLLPLTMSVSTLVSGNIDFGYDTARDFLSALDNLHKLTLIGPTSGIPGIFYGPYWIWLISIGLSFSRNPKLVVFLILTLPYFTIFPFVLFQFRKILGFTTCIILWLLFIFGPGMKYATSPWNPHPAPLLFLFLVYLITFTNFSGKGSIKYLKTLLTGIISGLILNFHISFGLGMSIGVIIFFIADFVRQTISKKQKNLSPVYLSRIFIFGFGILFTFLPFLLFEVRHGFNQLQTVLKVFSSKGSVVTVIGLSKEQILQSFFGVIGQLLKLPTFIALSVFILSTIYFIYQIRQKQIKLVEKEVRLFLLLLSIIVGILLLYLTSKNPVWGYHFIGVEIIFLFLIGLIIEKVKILRTILFIWIFLILILNSGRIINSFHQNPYINSSSLATEERIVRTIILDAKRTNFNVFAYSPSIYSYEYTYLFKWLASRDFPYDPGLNHVNADLVYLIIPKSSKEIKQNFINYHTSSEKYSTIKQMYFQDGTVILKRVKLR